MKIQDKSKPHDSKEDTIATMRIFKKYKQKILEFIKNM